MEFNNKIDIIIPVYNTSIELLTRCLSSIISQTLIKDLEVTIVDDASNINYDETINFFKKFFPIQYIYLKENAGPGIARQKGIEATCNEFIVFMDSDDILADCIALYNLRNELYHNPCSPYVTSYFITFSNEKREYYNEGAKMTDTSHVFGKIYRRAFIEKYNIHFHPSSRFNEDIGFNFMIAGFCGNNNNIPILSEVTYYQRYNKNSITKVDYFPAINLKEYVINVIYSFEYVLKNAPENLTYVLQESNKVLTLLYLHYMIDGPKYEAENLEAASNFFNNFYINIEQQVKINFFPEGFSLVLQNYAETGMLNDLIISISFPEYIKKIQEINKN